MSSVLGGNALCAVLYTGDCGGLCLLEVVDASEVVEVLEEMVVLEASEVPEAMEVLEALEALVRKSLDGRIAWSVNDSWFYPLAWSFWIRQ